MNNKTIIFLSVITLIMGCKTKPIDKCVIIDESYMSAIETYISKNPQYNTFLIKDSYQEMFSTIKYPIGILIGPGYRNLVEGKNYSYFDIRDSRVYIYSDTTVEIINKSNKNDYWINKNPRDSVILGNTNIWLYNSWENYIYKAAFIYKVNDIVYLNQRPDTIFVPQYVESQIIFTP